MLRYPSGAGPMVPPLCTLCSSLRALSSPSEAERYWLMLAKMPRVSWPAGVSSMFSVAESNLAPAASIWSMTMASSVRFRFNLDNW